MRRKHRRLSVKTLVSCADETPVSRPSQVTISVRKIVEGNVSFTHPRKSSLNHSGRGKKTMRIKNYSIRTSPRFEAQKRLEAEQEAAVARRWDELKRYKIRLMAPFTMIHYAGRLSNNDGDERDEMKTHDDKYADSPLKQLTYLEEEIAGWKDIHRDCQRQFDKIILESVRDFFSDYVRWDYVTLRSYVDDSYTKIKNLEKQLLDLKSRCQNETERTDMATKGPSPTMPSASFSSSSFSVIKFSTPPDTVPLTASERVERVKILKRGQRHYKKMMRTEDRDDNFLLRYTDITKCIDSVTPSTYLSKFDSGSITPKKRKAPY